jgi:hypothetical protein
MWQRPNTSCHCTGWQPDVVIDGTRLLCGVEGLPAVSAWDVAVLINVFIETCLAAGAVYDNVMKYQTNTSVTRFRCTDVRLRDVTRLECWDLNREEIPLCWLDRRLKGSQSRGSKTKCWDKNCPLPRNKMFIKHVGLLCKVFQILRPTQEVKKSLLSCKSKVYWTLSWTSLIIYTLFLRDLLKYYSPFCVLAAQMDTFLEALQPKLCRPLSD